MIALLFPRPMRHAPRPDHVPMHIWRGLTDSQRLALGPDGGTNVWDRLPVLGRLFVGAWIAVVALAAVGLAGLAVRFEIVYRDYAVYPFPDRSCAVRRDTPASEVNAVIDECRRTGIFAPQRNAPVRS